MVPISLTVKPKAYRLPGNLPCGHFLSAHLSRGSSPSLPYLCPLHTRYTSSSDTQGTLLSQSLCPACSPILVLYPQTPARLTPTSIKSFLKYYLLFETYGSSFV